MMISTPVRTLTKRLMSVPTVGLDISDRTVKFIRFAQRRREQRVRVDAQAADGAGRGAGGCLCDGHVKRFEY